MREYADWLSLVGMNGLGDNLHQRAVVRQTLEHSSLVLTTPWPCVYHDLRGPKLKLALRPTTLRTQAKNTAREQGNYDLYALPAGTRQQRVWYTGADVRARGSVLAAMMLSTGTDINRADFRLPVPPAWHARLDARLLGRPLLPLLVYRPLVERTEWLGCSRRNPDFDAYAQIFDSIRKHFFVVSIADLVHGKEWEVGHRVQGDIEFHRGELVFEELAALFQRATLVYSSPGFSTILAQAVGTPSVCVFGGYENASSFSAGARHAPYLGIDPISPCHCFSHHHACKKRIDVPAAIARLFRFIETTYADTDARAVRAHAADD